MHLRLSSRRDQRLMGGSHRLGREPCTAMLVHGGTLTPLSLIITIRRLQLWPLSPNLPPGVCTSGQTPQDVAWDVASSSTTREGWWTGVSGEGSTLCSGESAKGGGEEGAAVRLPLPRPPPALHPLPAFLPRPPLPLGTSEVAGKDILSIKDLCRA